MSARSRERWRRLSYIGQLRAAETILQCVHNAQHLPQSTRAEADRIAFDIYALRLRVILETKEPIELSAKKGT
jgi:hypothetical protein